MADKIYAGNFKLNKYPDEMPDYFNQFFTKVMALNADQKKDLLKNHFMFFPSTTNLHVTSVSLFENIIKHSIPRSPFSWGAQNIAAEMGGAFTGEISSVGILLMGGDLALIGHSERRSLFGETNEAIHKKIKLASMLGMISLLCIGETLQQREAGKTFDVLKEQLDAALKGFDKPAELVVAYEPVWAIGTGKVATSAQVEEVHACLRKYLDQAQLNTVKILYGGSVKPDNSKELIRIKNVDGFLIGGACLDPQSYLDICLSEVR